jgi:threonine/homoserine/homoserine lactone efflux protein
MHDLLSSLLGVPAVILLCGGLGIVVVTLASRVRGWLQPGRRPIRWAHLVFGVGLTGAGTLLLQLDISLLGVR